MKSPKILAALLCFLVACLAGLGLWIRRIDADHAVAMSESRAVQQREIAKLNSELAESLTSQQAKHDEVVKLLTSDYEGKLDGLRREQQTKMASAFKEFESIFDGNKKTIDYINALESRIKAGQSVSKAEVEKLAVIATGLNFLKKEYQKPFQEFRELESFLAKQSKGGEAVKPTAGFGFFKRMFNKDYREAEKEFYRNEGAKEAFAEAQGKFNSVYAKAQKQMSQVGIDGDQFTKKIYDLMDDKKNASAEDLTKFFDGARQALKTHQEVLDFSPEKLPEANKADL
jgi:hypothetical protein